MFQHKMTEKVGFDTYIDWFLLAFLAGSINAGGFMACNRFVSHVTGFATLAGISLKDGHWLEALGILSIPLYFLLGVIFSGYLTEKKLVKKESHQRYSPVMWLVTFFMAIVAIGGSLNWFGTFGETADLRYDYLLLALLCASCGLQNAAITSASGATIRTTHLTGLTTDLGLGLVRAKLRHLTTEEAAVENKANALRLGTIVSFVLGSAVGAILFGLFQYKGFFLPMGIAAYSSIKMHIKH